MAIESRRFLLPIDVVWIPETLPEREYEGRFCGIPSRKWGVQDNIFHATLDQVFIIIPVVY
jgi:hypothetical protein